MNIYKDIVNKLLSILVVLFVGLFAPDVVRADQYGQGGVILGESAQTQIVHDPINAGVSDTFVFVGITMLVSSLIFYLFYSRLNKVRV